MNLAEQLFNECSDAFEKVKPQLTEHVMSQLKNTDTRTSFSIALNRTILSE